MAMNGTPISSHISIRRRYVRSVDMERDVGDPAGLDGYVVTPSIRDATTRILSGLSDQSSQRAFRVVGPYGDGKVGIRFADCPIVCRSRGKGDPQPNCCRISWVTLSQFQHGARLSSMVGGQAFARELLNVVVRICDDVLDKVGAGLRENAQRLLDCKTNPRRTCCCRPGV